VLWDPSSVAILQSSLCEAAGVGSPEHPLSGQEALRQVKARIANEYRMRLVEALKHGPCR
jgi:hypothetical protein